MPRTDQAVGLSISVPQHVYDVLCTWASFELEAMPEDVLDALADELCSNEDLRTFAAALMVE